MAKLKHGLSEKRKASHGDASACRKVRFLFCASCDSTHKIEFAQQIHKNRGRGPDHPLLPLCGNSPCVPRFLYKGRKNVSGGRGFSSASETVIYRLFFAFCARQSSYRALPAHPKACRPHQSIRVRRPDCRRSQCRHRRSADRFRA